ncbi:MAG: hypothetical protein ACI9TH_001756 [Kiritimatiellia bacterium]
MIPRETSGEATAWLLDGRDPDQWFAELAGWQTELDELKACLVPQAGSLSEPAALLVLARRSATEAPGPRGQPLRCLGDKLYLPLHAELLPAIDAAEANKAVRTSIGLLHPVYGWVLFEDADFVPGHGLATLTAQPLGYVLQTMSPSGHVEGTSDVISFNELREAGMQMLSPERVFIRDTYYLLIGSLLVRFTVGGEAEIFDLGQAGRQLIASVPNTAPRLVVTFARGAQLFWLGDRTWTNAAFGHDLLEPRACFMRNGQLVLMDQQEGQIYDTQQQVIVFRHAMKPGAPGQVLDVVPGGQAHEFAECSRDGKMFVWKVQDG